MRTMPRGAAPAGLLIAAMVVEWGGIVGSPEGARPRPRGDRLLTEERGKHPVEGVSRADYRLRRPLLRFFRGCCGRGLGAVFRPGLESADGAAGDEPDDGAERTIGSEWCVAI